MAELQRDFEKFCADVVAGKPLIPNDHIRTLARQVVDRRGYSANFYEWARRLTDDVKGARD